MKKSSRIESYEFTFQVSVEAYNVTVRVPGSGDVAPMILDRDSASIGDEEAIRAANVWLTEHEIQSCVVAWARMPNGYLFVGTTQDSFSNERNLRRFILHPLGYIADMRSGGMSFMGKVSAGYAIMGTDIPKHSDLFPVADGNIADAIVTHFTKSFPKERMVMAQTERAIAVILLAPKGYNVGIQHYEVGSVGLVTEGELQKAYKRGYAEAIRLISTRKHDMWEMLNRLPTRGVMASTINSYYDGFKQALVDKKVKRSTKVIPQI